MTPQDKGCVDSSQSQGHFAPRPQMALLARFIPNSALAECTCSLYVRVLILFQVVGLSRASSALPDTTYLSQTGTEQPELACQLLEAFTVFFLFIYIISNIFYRAIQFG
jgi:hypothetical protein